MSEQLILYVVRNREGKFFRRKGFGGGGDSWVEDIRKARIFGKIAGARAVVGFFSKQAAQYGLPEIVPMVALICKPIDETERIRVRDEKAKETALRREERKTMAEIDAARDRLANLQRRKVR